MERKGSASSIRDGANCDFKARTCIAIVAKERIAVESQQRHLRCSCNPVARCRIDRALTATAALRRAFTRTGHHHNNVTAIGVPRCSCNSLKRSSTLRGRYILIFFEVRNLSDTSFHLKRDVETFSRVRDTLGV